MKNFSQFTLAIFSICLILLLGISTVSKTIHDRLFHFDSSSTSNSHLGCPNHQGCSSDHNETSRGEDHNQHSNGCDSSCPVNIFSSGILFLEYIEKNSTRSSFQSESISFILTSLTCLSEKKSHPVRGPPLNS